jgi:hypothetical protein
LGASVHARLLGTTPHSNGRLHVAERAGRAYLRAGLGLLRQFPGVYVTLFVLIAACTAVAGYLTVTEPAIPGDDLIAFALDFVSATVAPVIVMAAVAASGHGRQPGLWSSVRTGVPWLPRYLWTNLHTTLIFWIPVGAIVGAMRWQSANVPLEGAAGVLALAGWITAITASAVYLHSRTLLAPFFAIHGNMPGTIAVLESWRISGRYFWVVLGTFLVAALPPAIVPLALFGGTLVAFHGSGVETTYLVAATTSLVWAGIQFVRPFLVSAVYVLHRDLWDVEQERRTREGHLNVPRVLTPLVALSGAASRLTEELVWRLRSAQAGRPSRRR